MNINELVTAAHDNAVNKGWWDEERSFGEIVALIHSEVSEALEDYGNGHEPTKVWYEEETSIGLVKHYRQRQLSDKWKPCGIPSELADIVIRVMDACGRYGYGDELEHCYKTVVPRTVWSVFGDRPFAENLNIIHRNLTDCFRCLRLDKPFYFAIVVQNVEKLAGMYSIDLEQAIREKMAYNATRPHKHGGKVL